MSVIEELKKYIECCIENIGIHQSDYLAGAEAAFEKVSKKIEELEARGNNAQN
jgi:hypothetical protein